MSSNSRIFSTIALLIGALWATAAVAQVASSSQRHVLGFHRDRSTGQGPAATTSPPAIPYNGGKVFPNATTYAVWWGLPSDFPRDARDGINDFLQGLDGTALLDIADEYLFGQQAHTHFGGNFFDYSAPPTQDPPTSQIVTEVYNVLAANGVKPDPTALYAVYTSKSPLENYYCAFHDIGTAPDGTLIHIMFMPNPASDITFCSIDNVDPLYTPNRQSEPTRAMVNSTAHELMESITDPNIDGWVDLSSYTEIGDLCNFIFQSWVPLTNGRSKIQQIWSNQANGCVQGAGRTGRVLGAVSNAGAITTFNVPAGVNGIFGLSNNNVGVTAGYYADAINDWHGFLRGNQGKITIFDAPSASPLLGTLANSINDVGSVAGVYWDVNFVGHGFIRDTLGNYVSFDAPGASNTSAIGINNNGVVAGNFIDANSITHGFVRDTLGNFATFDAPGVANGYEGGTFVTGINGNGAVAGNYQDVKNVMHGFIRYADGAFATISIPGASQGTFAQSINNLGTVAGYFTDDEYVSHGFVRHADGTITKFDDPYATSGTFAYSINANGAIGGFYSDASGFSHGFIRDKYGSFFTLTTPGTNYGNVVRSINDFGATAGYDTKATF